MKKIRTILIFLALLMLSTFVSAQSFEVSLVPISEEANRIFRDEIAEFDLIINNKNNFDDRYTIYAEDSGWNLDREYITPITVPARSEKVVRITLRPLSSITASRWYVFDVVTESLETNQAIRSKTEILIKSEQHRVFSPSVGVHARINDDNIVDPRDDINLRVRLFNRNALNIPELIVNVESKFFSETYKTSLEPNSELIKTLTFPIDPYVEPQEDTLRVQVILDGKIITDNRNTVFQIQENKLFFTRTVEENKKFMYKGYNVTLKNFGNVPSSENFAYKIGNFERLFTKTVPEADLVKRNGVNYLEFSIALDSSESAEVLIVTDYRAFFYTTTTIILFTLFVLIFYYTFRTPIIVTKKATVVEGKDAGSNEIKIMLNIRNRTGKTFENISVVDRIPDITQIEEEFTLGTLKPTKIAKSKKGTIIKWDVPCVEGYEERIITYKIHSRLEILGEFILPPANLRFDTPMGNRRAIKSKAVFKPN